MHPLLALWDPHWTSFVRPWSKTLQGQQLAPSGAFSAASCLKQVGICLTCVLSLSLALESRRL